MNQFHEPPHVYPGEIQLNVTDLTRSLDFYTNVIGLKILMETKQEAVLTADGKTALVTLAQPEGIKPKQGKTAGLYHFALLLPDRKSLAIFLRHLLEAGQRFGAADHYVSEAIYIDDPDGNGIEVYRDRPQEEWTWNGDLVDMATVQLEGNSLLQEATEPFTGLPAGTIMGHIHLHVSDLAEAERFYKEGLGFDVVSHYPQALFISTGRYHHHIALNTWNGVGVPPCQPDTVGLNWYTLLFPTEAMRDEKIQQLQSLGYGVKEYMVTDPSGNAIRLLV